MPVINSNTPTIAMTVPVPTPVQKKPPAPKPAAPAQPQPQQQVQPQFTPPPRRDNWHAVILPWTPAAQKMARVGRRTRYASHRDFTRPMANDLGEDRTNPLVYADWLDENGYEGVAKHIRDTVKDRNIRNWNVLAHSTLFPLSNPVEGMNLPSGAEEGSPAAFITRHWYNHAHKLRGEPMIGVGTIHSVPADQNRNAIYIGRSLPITDAHALLKSFGNIPNADKAIAHLEKNFPHLTGAGRTPRRRLARLPRRAIKYADKPPLHTGVLPHLLPEEAARVSGMNAKSIKSINDMVRGGLVDRPGVVPTLSEITSLAEVGEPARGGYQKQYDAFEKLLHHPDDAARWATINAIFSANSPWEAYTADAIEAMSKWHAAGRPTHEKGLRQVFGTVTFDPAKGVWNWVKNGAFKGTRAAYGVKGKKLMDFLAQGSGFPGGVNWKDISEGSFKTPNFGLSFVDPKGVALDTHMARLLTPGQPFTVSRLYKLGVGAGVDASIMKKLKESRDKTIQDDKVYIAYKTLVSHAAERLGWEPREVQEAAWTGLLAIMALKQLDQGVMASPKASSILSKLSRKAVGAGWNLTGLLKSPSVQESLRLYGVSPRRVQRVIESQSSPATQRGSVGTSDPAALESAARRLIPEVPPAGQPIHSAIRETWKGSRKVRRYMRPGETTPDGGKFEPKVQPDLGEFIANQYKDEYGPPQDYISPATGFMLSDGRTVPMGHDMRAEDHRGAIPTGAAMRRWGWPKDVIRHHDESTRTPALFELMRRAGAVRVHAGDGQLVLHFGHTLNARQKRVIAEHINDNQPSDVLVSHIGTGKEKQLDNPYGHDVMRAIDEVTSPTPLPDDME